MIRNLDYQDRVLTTLGEYLEVLIDEKENADAVSRIAAENPAVEFTVSDFTKRTWERMHEDGKLPISRSDIPFSGRRDEVGRSVPNVVMKVPTGGGKTFLAVNAVSQIMGRYARSNTGFILWIVPSEMIYAQTLRNFKDRTHPYRQILDRVGAGRVRIMEKNTLLNKRDVETNLCVMLLMLQAANREAKDYLKIFKDRGDVHGFTPSHGAQFEHKRMLEFIPNLDYYDVSESAVAWPMIKDSLGNALRFIRPVIVLDEGHKATSQLALNTLYGFNPCFVLELTATPKDVQQSGVMNSQQVRYANILVDVTGRELDREGMIKMPLNLYSRQGVDWKHTLKVGIEKLKFLSEKAELFCADNTRYIRPIMLVQVERTGKDQREAGYIHTEDVRNWLIAGGFSEQEIAVKTAQRNDLNLPENQNLLSPTNRVRVIITHQALQEGWDCPFAYILCALAANSNINAMTQLIGRILRQPYARKTGVDALDECYVITHRASTAEVVESVKKGLERDGLGDLSIKLVDGGGSTNSSVLRKINRRTQFAKTEIYLPRVLLVTDDEIRELDYETDVVSFVDWRDFDPTAIAGVVPEAARVVQGEQRVIQIANCSGGQIIDDHVTLSTEVVSFDPVYAVRMICEIVLNPFVAREIVEKFIKALKERDFNENKIDNLSGLLIDVLHKGLQKELCINSEKIFYKKVEDGEIQFRLRTDGHNWQMPFHINTTEPEVADQLNGNDGGPLKRSLFLPVYKNELNGDERDVAMYLDGEEALSWWHRNAARSQYGLQGWKRHKVYPDFIFAKKILEGSTKLVVLETKGNYLDNLDTDYKKRLLDLMSDNFSWDNTVQAGELELVHENGEIVKCALVLMDNWQTELPGLLLIDNE